MLISGPVSREMGSIFLCPGSVTIVTVLLLGAEIVMTTDKVAKQQASLSGWSQVPPFPTWGEDAGEI